jgi:hypothetical protein
MICSNPKMLRIFTLARRHELHWHEGMNSEKGRHLFFSVLRGIFRGSEVRGEAEATFDIQFLELSVVIVNTSPDGLFTNNPSHTPPLQTV